MGLHPLFHQSRLPSNLAKPLQVEYARSAGY